MPDNTLRNLLRTGTSRQHERLDGIISSLDFSSRADYARFLRIHASVLLPLEAWLDAAGLPNEMPDWPQRRRSATLIDDLASLGAAVPRPVPLAFDDTPAARVGLVYVIEGSRMGARVLAGRLDGALPAKFLSHGKGMSLWPSFLRWLARQDLTGHQPHFALHAARSLFDLYGDAATNLTSRYESVS